MKKLICGDNLDILQSDAIDTASVDVVYLDPPFNSNQYYNLPFTKLGKDAAAVEAFKDIWSWDEATRDHEKRGSSTFQVDLPDILGRFWLRVSAVGDDLMVHGHARATPCKGWPSATAFGGFGLDKALPVRELLPSDRRFRASITRPKSTPNVEEPKAA